MYVCRPRVSSFLQLAAQYGSEEFDGSYEREELEAAETILLELSGLYLRTGDDPYAAAATAAEDDSKSLIESESASASDSEIESGVESGVDAETANGQKWLGGVLKKAASAVGKKLIQKGVAAGGKLIDRGVNFLKGLLGGKNPPLAPAPPNASPRVMGLIAKLAGPGGVLGANGKPLPPPININSLYPKPVDPMVHPVQPCCVMCDFAEDFPRKSEVKGRWAQRIERLRMGMTRRDYEKTQFQNEAGCCLMCPRYDPKQTANDAQSYSQRGHFPVRRPLRRKMRRNCCETCPSQFWIKDSSMDSSSFGKPKDAPAKNAIPVAKTVPKEDKPQAPAPAAAKQFY